MRELHIVIFCEVGKVLRFWIQKHVFREFVTDAKY